LKIKVGLGYDLHRLAAGKKLFLGGLEIPFSRGLAGHSDGDGLIHALIDALLGAMGDGDIGQLFSDKDPRYKNIRSTALLEDVMSRLEKKGWMIMNADCVVVAEEPKLAPFIAAIKDILCPILRIQRGLLGIKAKTNEGAGLIGRGKAIACWAVVLIGEKA
jgi:2-C-methyl-D-erythritol 2,4-cyclodiphosphate synthase